MINKILDFAFSGFFQFVGVLLFTSTIMHYLVDFIWKVLRGLMQMRMVCKQGWPPCTDNNDNEIDAP